MINWKLETAEIKKLKEYPKNPRSITKKQQQHLSDLLDKFGLIEKPIVNRDFMIIGGHQRIRLLKKKKIKQVECWMPDILLEQDDIDHLCVGLNLNQGHFDYDILANLFEPLDLLKYGFTEEQLLGCTQEIEPLSESGSEEEKKVKLTECPSCGCKF